MSERKQITEEMGLQKEWMAEAQKMTLERLPEFIKKLTEEYDHDYGTICHAIAASAIAAANAVNKSDKGGITGFQAGAVMWEMIKGWGVFGDGPKKMLCYEEMLYPQYGHHFWTIPPHVWDHLQKKAKKNLKDCQGSSPKVIAHWESIVSGEIPFGYMVEGKGD